MDYDMWKAGYYDHIEIEENVCCVVCGTDVTYDGIESDLTGELVCSDFCLIQVENAYIEDMELEEKRRTG